MKKLADLQSMALTLLGPANHAYARLTARVEIDSTEGRCLNFLTSMVTKMTHIPAATTTCYVLSTLHLLI